MMNSDKPLCPYCASKSELVKGSVIYPHRNDLYNLNFWLCAPCDAYVGCHKGTTNPLGRLANKELRSAKSEAHKFFDPLWHNSENVHKIIKPLYLGHEKLNDVYEHGDVWAGKLKRVRSQLPDLTLFAIDGNRHPRAIREISEELLRQDVFVEPYSPETIRNFAIQ